MDNIKIYPAKKINDFSVSVYSNKPEMHAYEHPDMVSVKVSDLFSLICRRLFIRIVVMILLLLRNLHEKRWKTSICR